MVMQESPLFLDDVGFILDLLMDNWSLMDKVPTFARETDVESFMMDARLGSVFVYSTGRTNKISTVDYRTLERVSNISIRVTTRFWDVMQEWGQEVYRILYSHRRMGYDRTNGYGYFEVLSDNLDRDLSGWYVTTFRVQMTAYATPLKTDGFGHDEEESRPTLEYMQVIPASELGDPDKVDGCGEMVMYKGVKHVRTTGIGTLTVYKGQLVRKYEVAKAKLDVMLLAGQSNTFYYSDPVYYTGDAPVPPGVFFYFGTEDVRGDTERIRTAFANRDDIGEARMTDLVSLDGKVRVSCAIPEIARNYYGTTGRRAIVLCTGIGGKSINSFYVADGDLAV